MRVYIIAAATVCGKIGPNLISTPADRRHLESWRERTDASLMGAATLRTGDPQMRSSGGKLPPHRIRCIITQSGQIPLDRSLFKHPPQPMIFTSHETLPSLTAKLMDRAHVIGVSPWDADHFLSLKDVVNTLKAKGVGSLLIEGGGKLNYEAIRQGIAHELILTILPQINGSHASIPLFNGKDPLNVGLMPMDIQRGNGGELFIRYEIQYKRP